MVISRVFGKRSSSWERFSENLMSFLCKFLRKVFFFLNKNLIEFLIEIPNKGFVMIIS